jgi:hypothetical protein
MAPRVRAPLLYVADGALFGRGLRVDQTVDADAERSDEHGGND